MAGLARPNPEYRSQAAEHINFNPSQVVLDARTPGPPAPPAPEPEPTDEDWRKRYADAQKKLSELGQKTSQQDQIIGQMSQKLEAVEQRSSRPAETSKKTPPAPAGEPRNYNSWQEYIQGTTAKETPMDQPAGTPPPGYLTKEEAERIADERIARTIGAIRQQEANGNALFEDFRQNHGDIAHLSATVASIYQNADPRVPQVDRYKAAVGQVRALVNSGQLPKDPPVVPSATQNPWEVQPRNPSMPAGGGQQMPAGAWAHNQTPAVNYDEKYLRDDLQGWADERKTAIRAKLR